MVPLLFLLRGLRNKGDKEKNRKREKRNEIQCINPYNTQLVGFNKPEFCSKKD